MSQLYVGIDPGEAHVGFAILNIKRTMRSRLWTLNMGVLDVKHHGFYHIVDTIGDLPQVSNMTIEMIIESYQQRPVGHQSFNTALTPQFIGAFRYIAHVQETEVYMIQPGPPEDLDKLYFTPILQQWGPGASTHKHWKHALSALRVVAIRLMTANPERLAELQSATQVKELDWERLGPEDSSEDFATPPVQWRTPL